VINSVRQGEQQCQAAREQMSEILKRESDKKNKSLEKIDILRTIYASSFDF